jgi:hypothetical protein
MRAQADELELERLNPDELGHLGPLSDLGLRPSRVRR